LWPTLPEGFRQQVARRTAAPCDPPCGYRGQTINASLSSAHRGNTPFADARGPGARGQDWTLCRHCLTRRRSGRGSTKRTLRADLPQAVSACGDLTNPPCGNWLCRIRRHDHERWVDHRCRSRRADSLGSRRTHRTAADCPRADRLSGTMISGPCPSGKASASPSPTSSLTSASPGSRRLSQESVPPPSSPGGALRPRCEPQHPGTRTPAQRPTSVSPPLGVDGAPHPH